MSTLLIVEMLPTSNVCQYMLTRSAMRLSHTTMARGFNCGLGPTTKLDHWLLLTVTEHLTSLELITVYSDPGRRPVKSAIYFRASASTSRRRLAFRPESSPTLRSKLPVFLTIFASCAADPSRGRNLRFRHILNVTTAYVIPRAQDLQCPSSRETAIIFVSPLQESYRFMWGRFCIALVNI
jgi:hypothetical protein